MVASLETHGGAQQHDDFSFDRVHYELRVIVRVRRIRVHLSAVEIQHSNLPGSSNVQARRDIRLPVCTKVPAALTHTESEGLRELWTERDRERERETG